MQLFSRFLEHFAHVQVSYLTADREFVGQDWFSYLDATPNTPFRIRIRENHKLFDGKHSLKVTTVFQDLQPAPPQVLRHQRRLWGHWLYIAALGLDDGNLLVVATQCKPQMAITDYANRWGIETLFGLFRH